MVLGIQKIFFRLSWGGQNEYKLHEALGDQNHLHQYKIYHHKLDVQYELNAPLIDGCAPLLV